MRAASAIAGLAVAALVVAGCGSPPDLPEQVAAELQQQAGAIRTAAAGGDRTGAEAALAQLHHRLVELQESGQVAGERAADILAAAAEVETQLALLPAPPPPPPPPTTVTAPPRSEGKGKGKHRGHDDEGD
jgi:hypothetical protein